MSPQSDGPTRRSVLAGGAALGLPSLLEWFVELFDRDAPYTTDGTACAGSVPTPTGADAGTWPTGHHDAGATGHNPAVEAARPGDPVWTQAYPPSTFPTEPAIGSARLYASVANYQPTPTETRVEARALADGERQWARSLPHRGVSPPALSPDGETLFVVSGQDESNVGPGQGAVFARDAASGDLRWRADFDRRLRGPLVVADGRVFVRNDSYGRAAVHALDAATGDRLWEFRTGDVLHNVPTVAGNRLFVNSGRERLTAVDVRDGTTDWERPVPGDSTRPVVDAARGHVLVGHFEGLAAHCAETGERAWHLFLTGSHADEAEMRGVIGAPVVTDRVLYVSTSDTTPYTAGGVTRLRGVDPTSGEVRWTADGNVGRVVGAGGRAVVERADGLRARAPDGSIAWRSDRSWRPVAVGPGGLYADRNNTTGVGAEPEIGYFPLG